MSWREKKNGATARTPMSRAESVRPAVIKLGRDRKSLTDIVRVAFRQFHIPCKDEVGRMNDELSFVNSISLAKGQAKPRRNFGRTTIHLRVRAARQGPARPPCQTGRAALRICRAVVS